MNIVDQIASRDPAFALRLYRCERRAVVVMMDAYADEILARRMTEQEIREARTNMGKYRARLVKLNAKIRGLEDEA